MNGNAGLNQARRFDLPADICAQTSGPHGLQVWGAARQNRAALFELARSLRLGRLLLPLRLRWIHLQLSLGWPSVRVCLRAPASPSLL